MSFLKRIGLGSSTSSSPSKKQPSQPALQRLPTPSSSSSSSIPTPPSSKRNSACLPHDNTTSVSRISSITTSTQSTAFNNLPKGESTNPHQDMRAASDSAAWPSVVSSSMVFVEEIIDDYTSDERHPDSEHHHSQNVIQEDSESPCCLEATNPQVTNLHNHQQPASQDHNHTRSRSMPLISSEEIQRFEQYATPTPDPSHTRPLCRQDSMAPLPSLMVNSTQRNRFLPRRRVTLNPGAALSTSALQSVLHPNIHERPPSPPKSEKSKRNRNKTSSIGFVNVSKWASRGGIGQKAEMMLDLETTGIFVPEIGRRLRPEFVYNITTQCADEIRARGLTHPNLFHNPAPKKVINSMISLLTDRQRCDLFSVKCMRIDTVASLLLNTISRMSNPIIPYDMMDYFYSHQFTIVPVSPTQSSSPHGSTTPLSEKQHHQSEESSSSSSTSSHQASMNVTPSSSPRNSLVTPPSSSTNSPVSSSWSYHQPSLHHYQQTVPFTTAWARHYFDLPSFLDNLPAINRSILLEVLHLCQEVLEHASENLVSVASLSEIISPALFSSVFDHKLLDRMAGHKRASIHGDGLSALEGVMQECQMFSAILVRFLVMTSATPTTVSTSPSSSPAMKSSTLAAYNNTPMTCTPMSSASASTTSIPLAVEATPLTLTPTPSIRTNRLSCPNLAVASFPIPVSVAKAKRTSMSPRPSVSEIRATMGIPLFRAEQEAMRAELQEYYQRMEQGFRELDLHRQPLPLSPTAVDLQKLSPISPVCLTNVKDEITAYHQVGDDLPDSNGQGQENQGVFSASILESPFGPKLVKKPVTEQLLAPPPVPALRPSVTNASKESIGPIEVVTAPIV